jgi:hypothetical protein
MTRGISVFRMDVQNHVKEDDERLSAASFQSLKT